MKAIILCAGLGGRLRPLTEDLPKCLLEVGGISILERCLESLDKAGVSEAVLVTGYKGDLVERAARRHLPGRVSFVTNGQYARTNTAFSLNLALKGMKDDFILVNGDVLFDRTILEDLIRHPSPNCLVVDRDAALAGEEVKVVAPDGRVERVGKDVDPRKSAGEAIGLNKIGRDAISGLMGIFEDLESRGEVTHYFEKGIDVMCGDPAAGGRFFGLLPTNRRAWVEIDTLEDYEYAQREVVPGLSR